MSDKSINLKDERVQQLEQENHQLKTELRMFELEKENNSLKQQLYRYNQPMINPMFSNQPQYNNQYGAQPAVINPVQPYQYNPQYQGYNTQPWRFI